MIERAGPQQVEAKQKRRNGLAPLLAQTLVSDSEARYVLNKVVKTRAMTS